MFSFYISAEEFPEQNFIVSKIYYDTSLDDPKLNYADVISVTLCRPTHKIACRSYCYRRT
jgi:hypothetical protein